MNEEFVGNFTTVIKTILCSFAGWCIGYFASKGFHLPIDAETLAEIIFTFLCFCWAYLDAKYPNAFGFLHKSRVCAFVETEEDLINEEYFDEDYYDDNDGCQSMKRNTNNYEKYGLIYANQCTRCVKEGTAFCELKFTNESCDNYKSLDDLKAKL